MPVRVDKLWELEAPAALDDPKRLYATIHRPERTHKRHHLYGKATEDNREGEIVGALGPVNGSVCLSVYSALPCVACALCLYPSPPPRNSLSTTPPPPSLSCTHFLQLCPRTAYILCTISISPPIPRLIALWHTTLPPRRLTSSHKAQDILTPNHKAHPRGLAPSDPLAAAPHHPNALRCPHIPFMLQVGIHSSQNAILGSRWPTLLSTPDAANARTNTQPPSPSSTTHLSPMTTTTTSSISRRKPKMTFRSPDASTPFALKLSAYSPPTSSERNDQTKEQSHSNASSPGPSSAPSVSTASAARSTCSFFTPSPPLFKMPLAYPSYHPFSASQLLLAATARADAAARRRAAAENGGTECDDTSLKGDDTAVNGSGRLDADGRTRRSSSRTRRPVAKLRDVVDGEEGANQENANKEDDTNGAKSPKRKRAGGGAGSRKRRKEAQIAQAEVQPRRERQRRGAAAAAAAALAENAEAVAAALDRDSTEAPEQDEVPMSVDGSAAPPTPEDDEKESEATAPRNLAGTKSARGKRQTRPKRSRNTSGNKVDAKEPTPTRTTRQSRRRGTSETGSEETAANSSTNGSAPVTETPITAKSEAQDDEVPAPTPVEPSAPVDDFNANIDPALLAEDASVAAASTGSAAAVPRSASP
ncbi:uncharacterized protein FOMMEDRAFT_168294 [Fomitiporia mediterranea MF3/22]|uniref:uncharacterized protein n=1 Tax=Fomitiporia mediterranea (strain MF3/22) TaxID=694068 RepID=UPI0004407EB0|nr:uncharacterized protein FOMMEDRAFT_168294 [Fomitiporia mediterranea MF3/22]EJD03287.1 hypothetical protein FOMMEDRAFT_168294 [Fomitiporia mediterranea MF3/22]